MRQAERAAAIVLLLYGVACGLVGFAIPFLFHYF